MLAASSHGDFFVTHLFPFTRLITVAGILVVASTLPALAQQTPPNMIDIRYETLLKDPKRNLATPGQEFGDQISSENGALSFSVVDVSIPGNNSLPVEFRRELSVTTPGGKLGPAASAMVDWRLGLPRIEASYDERIGWSSSDPNRRVKNCSIAQQVYIDPPPPQFDAEYYPAKLTWNPPTLVDPTSGSGGRLLYNKKYLPWPSTGDFKFWLTPNLSYVSCLPTLKNAGGATAAEQRYTAGEGFLLTRPDGVRVWFDWMSLRDRKPFIITKPLYNPPPATVITDNTWQETFEIYPTRMEDQYGNWVTFTYANKSNEIVRLTRIESSDGRAIDVGYNGNVVSTVTSGGRTWSYQYYGGLSKVTNPDGSSWQYDGLSTNRYTRGIASSQYGTCVDSNIPWNIANKDWTTTTGIPGQGRYTVKNPAGATADFYYDEVYQGRSNVIKRCFISGYSSYATGQVTSKSDVSSRAAWWGLGVVGKRVSGPGLPEMWWRYSYQSTVAFAPNVGANYSKTLEPDGTLIERTYGNQAGKDEGLLLEMVVKKNGTVLKREKNTYLSQGNTNGFPKLVGFHPNSEFEYPAEVRIRPLMSRSTELDGRIYEWKCDTGAATFCLDEYGRPLQTVLQSRPVTP
jgi:YD repeat-containing protein